MVTTTALPLYTLEQAEAEISQLRGQIDALQEVLQQFNGPVPNTPPSGAYDLFAQGGQPNYVNGQGLQMSLVGAQGATFPGTTVAVASLTTIASFTIPANDANASSVYELEVWGNGVQGTIGNRQTLEFSISLGGTAMTNITYGTTALPDTQAAFRFLVRARVICHTTGVSGTWTSYLESDLSQFNTTLSASNANTQPGFSCESTGTTTKDTTSSQTLAVQAAWGATTGGPTLTSLVALPKRYA